MDICVICVNWSFKNHLRGFCIIKPQESSSLPTQTHLRVLTWHSGQTPLTPETTLTLQRLHGSRRQQYLLESQDVRLQGEAGVSSLSERYKDWWWPKVLTAEMGGGYHSDCCTCRVPGVLDVFAVSAGASSAQTDRIGPLSATTRLGDPPVPQMHPYTDRTQKQTKIGNNYSFRMDRTSKIAKLHKDPSCQASNYVHVAKKQWFRTIKVLLGTK